MQTCAHATAIALTHSSCEQDQAIQYFSMDGGGAHKPSTPSEDPVVAEGSWGRESRGVASGRWLKLQQVAPQLFTYKQH